ncbi:hypothetical protein HDU93_008083, partial [Gonapodya sp. JEL0774]
SDGCVDICFMGMDGGWDKGHHEHGFERALSKQVVEMLGGDILLAWEHNGMPLQPQHGFPLRLIVPGWYGMASVKWLRQVAFLPHTFTGVQHTKAYRYRSSISDSGVPATHMKVKSLMVPPGEPDWWSGDRLVDRSTFPSGEIDSGVKIAGRAWSGAGVPISNVELGVRSRSSSSSASYIWEQCTLIPPPLPSPYSWCRWEFLWKPGSAGDYLLACRATDANWKTQPLEPEFDVGGFGNNAVQEVAVTVR